MEKGILEIREQYEKYVNECELKTPEEVERLFFEYTMLIWNYNLVGYYNLFYDETTVVYRENCVEIVGCEPSMFGTMAFQSAVPNLKFRFTDIFAEEDGNGGYKFAQSLYYDGKNDGYSDMGEPSGKALSEEGKYCFGLCWVNVKKINGAWKISEEWLIRDSAAMKEIFTKDKVAEKCECNKEVR